MLVGQKFAKESSISPKATIYAGIVSEMPADSAKRSKLEANFWGFYEPGDLGDWNIDLDQTVYRFHAGDQLFWVGRTHSKIENNDVDEVSHRSALGSAWVQNQTDPLRPRVSGWIGLGSNFRIPKSSVFVTLSYSPLFLPTFGPRLDLSDVSSSTGARFSRLPPSQIKVGEALLPLRYKLETGEISEIVFQSQMYLELGTDNDQLAASAFAWSAPNPDPVIDATGILRVSEENVDALAVAVPSFPRENFIGIDLEIKNAPGEIKIEIVHEITAPETIVSLSLSPFNFLNLGSLNAFYEEKVDTVANAGSVARYDKQLVWVKLFVPESSDMKIRPSLLVESHWNKTSRGSWWLPGLEYRWKEYLSAELQASILAGDNNGFYGNWRSLDSISLGVSARW